MKNSIGRRLKAAVAAAVVAAATVAVATVAAPAVAAPEVDCREVRHTVTDIPLAPGEHVIAGTLCAPPDARTVQLLVHGATYGAYYWDFPYEPERYSYVDAMSRARLATFNVDLLGVGASDHPPSLQVSLLGQIAVVRQLAAALRDGTLGTSPTPGLVGLAGRGFENVVLVGHSLGTLLTTAVATANPDLVDGLIATGISHGFDHGMPTLLLEIATHPARLDGGRFGDLDLGYLTTQPGNRAEHFYHQPAADPQVIAVDEAAKQTMTLGEVATYAPTLITSATVQAPVLAVLGEHDGLSCRIIACSSPASPWNAERLLYPLAAGFEQYTLPAAGHDINLHPNAHEWFERAATWVRGVDAGTTG